MVWTVELILILKQEGNARSYKILDTEVFSNKTECENGVRRTLLTVPEDNLLITHRARKYKMRYEFNRITDKLEVRGFLGEAIEYKEQN